MSFANPVFVFVYIWTSPVPILCYYWKLSQIHPHSFECKLSFRMSRVQGSDEQFSIRPTPLGGREKGWITRWSFCDDIHGTGGRCVAMGQSSLLPSDGSLQWGLSSHTQGHGCLMWRWPSRMSFLSGAHAVAPGHLCIRQLRDTADFWEQHTSSSLQGYLLKYPVARYFQQVPPPIKLGIHLYL